MPDIAGVLNLEVRLPVAEGPRHVSHVFVELEDEGTVALGVAKENGEPYAYAKIDEAQWWRLTRILFPRGDPGDGGDEVRRDGD